MVRAFRIQPPTAGYEMASTLSVRWRTKGRESDDGVKCVATLLSAGRERRIHNEYEQSHARSSRSMKSGRLLGMINWDTKERLRLSGQQSLNHCDLRLIPAATKTPNLLQQTQPLAKKLFVRSKTVLLSLPPFATSPDVTFQTPARCPTRWAEKSSLPDVGLAYLERLALLLRREYGARVTRVAVVQLVTIFTRPRSVLI